MLPAAGATTKRALHRTAAQTAPAALHARLVRLTFGPWPALNPTAPSHPGSDVSMHGLRHAAQHTALAAPPRRVSRLSVYGWQPPGSRTMPSCLCCEQKRPRPSPAWLKLGRLLQPSAAQRFCFTLTMPGRRCGEQYRPCARARPAARGGPARAGSGAGRVPRARCIRRRCGRRDADAHEPCHCVRWHGMSGGSEWLRPCTQQQHHAAGPAPGAAPPQRCWKATERREAGRGAAPACSRAC